MWRRYFDVKKLQPPPPVPGNQMFVMHSMAYARIEKRLRGLQEHLERLEKRQEEMFERLLRDSNRQKSHKQEDEKE